MQDTPDRQAEILEHLRAKGFSACPVCSQPLVEQSGDIGFGAGKTYAFLTAEDEELHGMIPVICKSCGHVLWFNAAQLPGWQPE